jgi:hypothetical protein
MALKQLGMQQSQIDQANKQLDAEIWYMQQQAKRALKADKNKRKDKPKPTAEQYGEGPGYASVGGNWWPPTETGLGGNSGALGQGVAPVTSLPPSASPQIALQWLQTQPLQTQAGRQAAAQQLTQWVKAAVAPMVGLDIQVSGDGSIHVANYSGQPLDPGVQGVVDSFNSMIGGA